MNCYYVYQYENGLQFVSTGEPAVIRVSVERQNGPSVPRVLGCWRIKEWKKQNPDRVYVSDSDRTELIYTLIELFHQIYSSYPPYPYPSDYGMRHKTEAGKIIIEAARKKFGFSRKTVDQDLFYGFWRHYLELKLFMDQIITATFTGTPSLGYVPGEQYKLIIPARSMSIMREDGSGRCPYGSLTAFLANWSNIQHITK